MCKYIGYKKARGEYQQKHGLSDEEMTYVSFMKIGKTYRAGVYNLQVYAKITPLDSELEGKAALFGAKFEELTRKFLQEDVFEARKEACADDIRAFLYLFQYNTFHPRMRISFMPGTAGEQKVSIWSKADAYLDAICLYHLLSLGDELGDKYAVMNELKTLLRYGALDMDASYEDIRALAIEKVSKRLAFANSERAEANEWLGARAFG